MTQAEPIDPLEPQPPKRLRTRDDLVAASEWLFNQQRNGVIDAKTADALNTTLKGSVHMILKHPTDLLKIYVQARIKKVSIPPELWPVPSLTE